MSLEGFAWCNVTAPCVFFSTSPPLVCMHSVLLKSSFRSRPVVSEIRNKHGVALCTHQVDGFVVYRNESFGRGSPGVAIVNFSGRWVLYFGGWVGSMAVCHVL